MISIIIPAYIPTRKHHALFIRAIRSLEKQTYKDFEVICVLNGCYTDYGSIISSVITDLNIHYKFLEGKTSGAIARNFGIKVSKRKYVAQLDVDDQYHPEKLEKQIEFLEKNPYIDVLGTLAYSYFEDGKHEAQSSIPDEYSTHQQISERLKVGNCMCHGSIMFKRSVFDKFSYEEKYKPGAIWPSYGVAMWEDLDLWKRMTSQGVIFQNLNDRLYFHSVGTAVER